MRAPSCANAPHGATGRGRTGHLHVTNVLLCQMSYSGLPQKYNDILLCVKYNVKLTDKNFHRKENFYIILGHTGIHQKKYQTYIYFYNCNICMRF